jgi:hypothetical protein
MNSTYSNSPSQCNVDGLMQSFFKKEIPDPWPEARVPALTPAATRKPWLGSHGRLALVASVAIFLFSYLTLAARFPAEPEAGLILNRNQTIGFKQRVPTPRGGEALLWEELIPAVPGKPPTIIINVQELSGPQKR